MKARETLIGLLTGETEMRRCFFLEMLLESSSTHVTIWVSPCLQMLDGKRWQPDRSLPARC